MTTLSFRDLALRTPDGRTLLEGASQTLPPGLTGLVGANGTGKSTLLRTLAGESPPAAGRLLRHGRVGLVAPPSPLALAAELAGLPATLRGAPGAIRRSVARDATFGSHMSAVSRKVTRPAFSIAPASKFGTATRSSLPNGYVTPK